jgi:hypothetical protein
MLNSLRPYQLEIANAVLDSVFYRKGLTFYVEIARQGGKNELSARLERLRLSQYGTAFALLNAPLPLSPRLSLP